MKEIKIERAVYDIEYEAADGTRFSDKTECEKYDKTVSGLLRGYLREMSLKVETEENLLNTGSCETELFTAVPNNEQDLDRIKQLILAIGGSSDVSKITKDLIGRVVLVYIGYNNEWVYIDTLDKMVERLTDSKWEVIKK